MFTAPAQDEGIPASPGADDLEPLANVSDPAQEGLIPASPEADDPELLADVYFPRLREVMNASMDALIEGELVLEGSCIRLKSPDGYNKLLIWPQRFKLSVEGGDIRISDDSGVFLSIGEEISVGGGGVPRRHIQPLVEQPIPRECRGSHPWLIGEESRSIQKRNP